ncbi:Reverse transcriptase (RNA-dependent DNA polymerase) [[Clostridium] sordellii]|uniref:reverse transcriptase domain-containing protein n=1 Tax=Paraclostridium sordellii TaxID=1505 RepID=UPI0005EA04FA|nr:reverse transcriptase domain-containing protein [Paeniclostridium sordellii]MBX9179661.1 hypothetical protein [Paeniclostridium sordellii]CEO12021.1 Reverse transcriptase (RNA-dependent DNA polymerase) [[Clostridium] sordellii] [Paeniclostridium sordellii]
MKLDDFKREIDDVFWANITSKIKYKDIVNFNDINKDDFLDELVEHLELSNYSVSTPIYYYFPKSKGILRRVKIYRLKDICVYYYCVKKLENKLVNKIKEISTAFGGFKFSKDNKSWNNKVLGNFDEGEYESIISRDNYRQEWKDYTKMALGAYKKGFKKYIHIDISHFYDDINLDILEGEVRNIIVEQKELIDLLFYFLRMSDNKDLGYSIANVGIPQEEIGEMSRVLANFYLASYDKNIVEYLDNTFGLDNYLYFRYSDDMWFCINEDLSNHIIQKASLLLNSIKLHINTEKIKVLSNDEFNEYWKFSEWDKVTDNKDNINYLINIHHIFNENNQTGRWSSLAKYYIKVLMSNLENIKVIHKSEEMHNFIKYLLKNPQIVQSLDETHRLFLVEMINKYNEYINIFVDYIISEENIYPSIEYFILEILTSIESIEIIRDFIIEFFEDKYKFNKEGNWYTRCICVRFFIKYKYIFISDKRYLNKILKTIDLYKSNIEVYIERRYILYFLYVYGLEKDVIYKKVFNNTEDKLFKLYLRGV